jgi:hypothetical protein
MNTITFVNTVINWLLADPAHVIVAASLLASITPTPNPATPAGKVYKALDLMALNFLHAKSTGVALPDLAQEVAAILVQQQTTFTALPTAASTAAPTVVHPQQGIQGVSQ